MLRSDMQPTQRSGAGVGTEVRNAPAPAGVERRDGSMRCHLPPTLSLTCAGSFFFPSWRCFTSDRNLLLEQSIFSSPTCADPTVAKIDNYKFKFQTRFIMTRIKLSMHDFNILDSTYIINMISENMIIKRI